MRRIRVFGIGDSHINTPPAHLKRMQRIYRKMIRDIRSGKVKVLMMGDFVDGGNIKHKEKNNHV